MGTPGLKPDLSSHPDARPDWPSLVLKADLDARARVTNNPFGFDDTAWEVMQASGRRWSFTSDAELLSVVQRSAVWSDLELLLKVLSSQGARPLLLSPPLPGTYMDSIGVSSVARKAFHRTLRDLVGAYGMPLVDFADRDNDRYFVMDPGSHPSAKGWLYFDQVLDAFFHQRPLRGTAVEAAGTMMPAVLPEQTGGAP